MRNPKGPLAAVAAITALSGQALAASATWLVTEENIGGIKGGQGTWTINLDGDRLSGAASMQGDTGNSYTYKLEGAVAGGVYTVTMTDRSDGKKGCVWSGHVPAGTSAQKKGLIGYAECEGTKLIVRVSIPNE